MKSLTVKQQTQDKMRRVPQYLQNNMGGTKIQKENLNKTSEEKQFEEPRKRKERPREISQFNKLELERLVHQKGDFNKTSRF